MSSDFKEFQLDTTSYANFDGLSLRDTIISKLNETGIFTDQNYEGSNISSFIDIISYSFHTLLFYLNKTSTEAMFSESQIYENMSRIVKLLDYKPIGNQTAVLNFNATALDALTQGNYTIPRYTYFKLGNVFYSFSSDASFSKLTNEQEALTNFSDKHLLYQGKWTEYPTQTAIGNEFEIFVLNPGDDIIVDHFNLDVYIQYASGVWEKWEKTESLFLENATAKKYEVRLNENGRYEFKFGNDINGRQLQSGENVAIYFITSTGSNGEVGVGELDGNFGILFKTSRFEQIKNYIFQNDSSIITDIELQSIEFTNTNVSSSFSLYENVESIRQNAPKSFSYQYRLVTKSDFENYILGNFSNLVKSVKVFNNNDFLSKHVKYLYDIGVENPAGTERISLNQTTFSSACNFNNVYVYLSPTIENRSESFRSYMNTAQKNAILRDIDAKRIQGSEIIFEDPIYIAIDLGVSLETEVLSTDIGNNTELGIYVSENNRKNEEQIIEEVYNIFYEYFKYSNTFLGQTIDISSLYGDILAVRGIERVMTSRLDINHEIEGLSLLYFNPIYPTADIDTVIKNIKLQDFQVPYFVNLLDLKDKIKVYSS